jgi:exodeoxyribonuclease VII small subunit
MFVTSSLRPLETDVTPASDRPNPTGETAEAYDALVSRLERVVADLEEGKLTLEQSIEKFADGVRLAREATRKLDEAERRVDLLVRTADGGEEAVPFTPDAQKGA